MIDLRCVRCVQPQSAHNLGSSCSDGARSPGFVLVDGEVLRDVPIAERPAFLRGLQKIERPGDTAAGAGGLTREGGGCDRADAARSSSGASSSGASAHGREENESW